MLIDQLVQPFEVEDLLYITDARNLTREQRGEIAAKEQPGFTTLLTNYGYDEADTRICTSAERKDRTKNYRAYKEHLKTNPHIEFQEWVDTYYTPPPATDYDEDPLTRRIRLAVARKDTREWLGSIILYNLEVMSAAPRIVRGIYAPFYLDLTSAEGVEFSMKSGAKLLRYFMTRPLELSTGTQIHIGAEKCPVDNPIYRWRTSMPFMQELMDYVADVADFTIRNIDGERVITEVRRKVMPTAPARPQMQRRR